MYIEQLSLPLFPQRTYDELINHHKLSNLNVFVNKRLRRGWQVRIKRISQARDLIIPPYLENAPENIKMALIEWALLPSARNRDKGREIRLRQKQLETTVWEYLESTGITYHNQTRIDPAKVILETRGCIYDLQEVFDTLNSRWFHGELKSLVRWGCTGTTTSYQTSRTAPDGRKYNLITIAGAYDHREVPRFAIEAVMYHEMLHIAIPPVRSRNRRIIHSRAFTKAEQAFPDYSKWHKWEIEHLRRLARNLKRAEKQGRCGSGKPKNQNGKKR